MTDPKLYKISVKKGNKNLSHTRNLDENITGTAPYNFIPLNSTALMYDSEDPNLINHEKYFNSRRSGYLECTLESLSNIFIGSPNDKNSTEFFMPAGKPLIPGSSIRGMLRNMVNIISYGKFETDGLHNHLYSRPFAGNDRRLRNWYDEKMTNTIPNGYESRKDYKALAGYLTKGKNRKWYIQPAQNSNNSQFTKISSEDVSRELKEYRLKPYSYYKWTNGGMVIVTNKTMQKGKNHDWLVHSPDFSKSPISVPEQVIDDYRLDTQLSNPSRRIKINILKSYEADKSSNFKDGIPVFYTLDNSNKDISAFGHGPMFRQAYDKNISDHLQNKHKTTKHTDMAERLFGNINLTDNNSPGSFAGSINVEDARLIGDPKWGEQKSIYLSGPKPTHYTNYLVQDVGKPNQLKNWNDDTLIRGFKMYWHQQNITENQENQFADSILPLSKGNKFSFKIYFDNITSYELGALLTAVNLKEGLAHKIGRGKSIGLGSVKIIPKLYLIDSKSWYNKIFHTLDWKLGYNRTAKFQIFMDNFQNFIVNNVDELENDRKSSSFWDLYRMRQLSNMLDINKGMDHEKSGKLAVHDFKNKNKKILPIPEDV